MEDSVVDYAELLDETDEPSEVPPVPTAYGTTSEDRYAAEFHYAIWVTERDSWGLFPSYSQYLQARKDGKYVAVEQ